MISRALSVLRTKVRQRADMANSQFVSDAEVNDAINYAGRSLFAVLIQAYGEGHYESTTTFATVAGTYNYSSALPSDFYRLLGMTAVISGTVDEVVLQRGTPEDMRRNTLSNTGWDDAGSVYYELRGQTIRLAPTPSAVHTVTIRYVSANLFFNTGGTAIVELTADTDKIMMEELLWEEFVITMAAIRCMRKEQSDTSDLRQDLSDVTTQIMSSAAQRDQGEPSRIRMVM
jgi:hypothetical protein